MIARVIHVKNHSSTAFWYVHISLKKKSMFFRGLSWRRWQRMCAWYCWEEAMQGMSILFDLHSCLVLLLNLTNWDCLFYLSKILNYLHLTIIWVGGNTYEQPPLMRYWSANLQKQTRNSNWQRNSPRLNSSSWRELKSCRLLGTGFWHTRAALDTLGLFQLLSVWGNGNISVVLGPEDVLTVLRSH